MFNFINNNNEQQYLVVMVGIPGSGKSTIAKQLAAVLGDGCKIFSSDEYRKNILGNEDDQTQNDKIFKALYNDLVAHLTNNKSAIIDATNVTLKARRGILKLLNDKKLSTQVNKICYVVNTPIDICIKQDLLRETRHVGESVINKMIARFQMPHYFEGWDTIYIHEMPSEESINSDKNFTDLNTLIEKMYAFNQKNPHHLYSVGEHCARVFQQFFSSDDTLIRATAGQFHDVGKLLTQQIDSEGIAHYYNHDSVGTYFMLSHLDLLMTTDINDIVEILFYINYHMRAHNDFRGTKAMAKYCGLFGQDRLNKLFEFAAADVKASGTNKN